MVNEYISEVCTECGKEMNDIEDIFVDSDTDKYVCAHCSKTLGLKTVKCKDL